MSKSACGYESRSAAIRGMTAQNVDRYAIAHRLSKDQLEKARRHARRRNITIDELLKSIIETVLNENIVDAVLDD